ncbi:DUF3313 domain-containing protein [Spongiimicrobium sp. 2-473A-2-J]|uniref:DUF3313 domain-containing protein n=1 Tax=Eudoraea algarum TaxID=3417568 RepID=UPI003D363510
MMFKKRTINTFVLGIAVALAVGSCGSSGKAVKNYTATSDLSGLVEDTSQAPTLLYIRPNAPSLGAYDAFILDPVVLDPRDPSIKKLKTEDLKRIQTYFTESLTKELEGSGYTITSTPAEKTLRISFVLSGIKVPNATANVTSVLIPVALSVGGVTVEGTFRESISNRIDAVVISRSQGSRVANDSPWSTWADVESALDQWAKGIAASVDKAHDE